MQTCRHPRQKSLNAPKLALGLYIMNLCRPAFMYVKNLIKKFWSHCITLPDNIGQNFDKIDHRFFTTITVRLSRHYLFFLFCRETMNMLLQIYSPETFTSSPTLGNTWKKRHFVLLNLPLDLFFLLLKILAFIFRNKGRVLLSDQNSCLANKSCLYNAWPSAKYNDKRSTAINKEVVNDNGHYLLNNRMVSNRSFMWTNISTSELWLEYRARSTFAYKKKGKQLLSLKLVLTKYC